MYRSNNHTNIVCAGKCLKTSQFYEAHYTSLLEDSKKYVLTLDIVLAQSLYLGYNPEKCVEHRQMSSSISKMHTHSLVHLHPKSKKEETLYNNVTSCRSSIPAMTDP